MKKQRSTEEIYESLCNRIRERYAEDGEQLTDKEVREAADNLLGFYNRDTRMTLLEILGCKELRKLVKKYKSEGVLDYLTVRHITFPFKLILLMGFSFFAIVVAHNLLLAVCILAFFIMLVWWDLNCIIFRRSIRPYAY